jgi:uncharacterized SAM-binding protein YcdF (DUF218 family)
MIIIRLFHAAAALCLTTLLLITLGWIWFAGSLVTMKPDVPNARTDAIIVLTGGKNRIEAGLSLLQEKRSDKLFISGVNKETTLADLVGGRDVPCCITLGYRAEDTIGNADEARDWVRENDIRSIRLVTSNYHMARARLEFDRAIPDLTIYDHPILNEDEDIARRSFLERTTREYIKLIGAFVRTPTYIEQ